jgi:hypothetical protein
MTENPKISQSLCFALRLGDFGIMRLYGRVNWDRISPLGPHRHISASVRPDRAAGGVGGEGAQSSHDRGRSATAAQVAENQPALADALRARVAEFDYGAVLTAIAPPAPAV